MMEIRTQEQALEAIRAQCAQVSAGYPSFQLAHEISKKAETGLACPVVLLTPAQRVADKLVAALIDCVGVMEAAGGCGIGRMQNLRDLLEPLTLRPPVPPTVEELAENLQAVRGELLAIGGEAALAVIARVDALLDRVPK